MVKVKPLDGEVVMMVNTIAAMCGPKLASQYAAFKDRTGFAYCHVRELGVYALTDPRFTRHMPRVFDIFRNDEREAYVLVLERLQDVHLLDSAADPSGWDRAAIEAALRGAAEFHSVYYGREAELIREPWLGICHSTASMTEMIPLWEALGVHAAEEFPELVDQSDLALHRQLVHSIPDWWARMESLPRTLTHNDFNPRNICLRQAASGQTLCAYDWELATVQVPQHDLAELLCFVLPPQVSIDEVDHFVEFHRQCLEKAVGQEIDRQRWRDGYRFSLYDLAVNRMALYVMSHTFRHYAFMERVLATLRELIRFEKF